jgi:hypothetical protein
MLRICQGTIWLDEYTIPEGEMSTKKVDPILRLIGWDGTMKKVPYIIWGELIFLGICPKI